MASYTYYNEITEIKKQLYNLLDRALNTEPSNLCSYPKEYLNRERLEIIKITWECIKLFENFYKKDFWRREDDGQPIL